MQFQNHPGIPSHIEEPEYFQCTDAWWPVGPTNQSSSAPSSPIQCDQDANSKRGLLAVKTNARAKPAKQPITDIISEVPTSSLQ